MPWNRNSWEETITGRCTGFIHNLYRVESWDNGPEIGMNLPYFRTGRKMIVSGTERIRSIERRWAQRGTWLHRGQGLNGPKKGFCISSPVGWEVFFFKLRRLYFFLVNMYECFVYMYISALRIHLVPLQARNRYWIIRNWSDRCL